MFKILIFILTMIATSSSLDFSTEIAPRNPCTGLHIVEGIALVAWGGKIENDALKSTKDKTTQAQIIFTLGKEQIGYLQSAEKDECTEPVDDQKMVCQAIKEFIDIEDETLKTIKELSNTLTGVPKHDFSSILQFQEDGITSYLFNLTNVIPDCVSEVAPIINSLVSSLKATVDAYSEY